MYWIQHPKVLTFSQQVTKSNAGVEGQGRRQATSVGVGIHEGLTPKGNYPEVVQLRCVEGVTLKCPLNSETLGEGKMDAYLGLWLKFQDLC